MRFDDVGHVSQRKILESLFPLPAGKNPLLKWLATRSIARNIGAFFFSARILVTDSP